jgi:microcystin-dependent protein
VYYAGNYVGISNGGTQMLYASPTEVGMTNPTCYNGLRLNGHHVLEVGDIKVSARATPSPGWLYCNGLAYSRATYAALFAAIGTTYGAGDGSTTFNVPDCRGRVLASQDNMGREGAGRIPWLDYLGDAGGEHQVYVTQWHLPNITLSANTDQQGYHYHQYYVPSGSVPIQGGSTWTGSNYSFTTTYTTGDGVHGHNVQVPLGGSGGALNNVPPVIALHTFIYAGV